MYKYIELKTIQDVKNAHFSGHAIEFLLENDEWTISNSANRQQWDCIEGLMKSEGTKYRALVVESGFVTLDREGNPVPDAEEFLIRAINNAVKEATGLVLNLGTEDLAETVPTKVALQAIRDAVARLNK